MFFHRPAKPVIVAGPCSVESRSSLEAVSRTLARLPHVSLIRAGVWKPRTRPGSFEGLGEVALQWMEELAPQLGVSYCCEVAAPHHVALCLRHGVRAVWIGARTTANPFMVDELCVALKGTDVAVMVKNPVCPDARLWVGAVERLAAAGITDVAAVHRGFNMYNNRGYRNAPMWEVAMEFRHDCPSVPILCDPSHMGGRRDLVAPLADAARLLGYDGLMVEVHPNPDAAWSDVSQQLSPTEFSSLLQRLACAPSPSATPVPSLIPLREQIDAIDHELISLLARRMQVSRSIAQVKRDAHLPVYQPDRWKDLLADRLGQATSQGLDSDFTRDLLEKIHGESVRIQMEK